MIKNIKQILENALANNVSKFLLFPAGHVLLLMACFLVIEKYSIYKE